MIKLIASDIDGTLVKDGTLAIDREYMKVIGRLIRGLCLWHAQDGSTEVRENCLPLLQTDCFISLTEELLYGLRRRF